MRYGFDLWELIFLIVILIGMGILIGMMLIPQQVITIRDLPPVQLP